MKPKDVIAELNEKGVVTLTFDGSMAMDFFGTSGHIYRDWRTREQMKLVMYATHFIPREYKVNITFDFADHELDHTGAILTADRAANEQIKPFAMLVRLTCHITKLS